MPDFVDESDPRAIEGLKELERRMMHYFRVPRALDRSTVDEFERLVYDFRVWFKNRYGLTFPELVPFALPSIGYVKFYRRDWPDEEIRRNLLFLIEGLKRIGKSVSPLELAAATAMAWPHYRPRDDAVEIKDRETVQ